jgi:hypothetical protein
MSENPVTKKPQLSIVIASFNNNETLDLSLSSVQQQKQPQDTEVIVVRDWNFRRRTKDGQPVQSEQEQALRNKFKSFKWIDAPAGATVPLLRSLGLIESTGTIVAFMEDDCVLAGTYITDLIAAHKAHPNVAIGGAVEPGNYVRGTDWAVFFCEYARFMRPFEGDVPWLPGNNVSYKRERMLELLQDTPLNEGFFEVFVNAELEKKGEILFAVDAPYVQNVNSWLPKHLTEVPFSHGRGFAAMRFARQDTIKRLLYALISFLLPLIQTYRIVKQIYLRQRYFAETMQALPGIVLFCTSWAAGEFTGYLAGAGDSLKQWR